MERWRYLIILLLIAIFMILLEVLPPTTTYNAMENEPVMSCIEDESKVVEVKEPDEVATFRITAYCSCEKCCGKWAKNRPLNENGEPLVVGASGQELVNLISCASPLPFGTQIQFDGIGTLVVHDRTADWVVDKYGNYIVDIYMSNHQEALDWGVKYYEGSVFYE